MLDKLQEIQTDYLEKITHTKSLKKLDELFLDLFGKKGVITQLPKEFSKLSKEELEKIGPLFNQIKHQLEQAINTKRREVKEEGYKELEIETLDLDQKIKLPKRSGHLHPLTIFEREIVDLFKKIGFQQYQSPEIDTDFNNFEVLNIPPEHPARDLWDTLYIDSKNNSEKGKLLLRTHATNFQIWAMKAFKPPIRLINVGRCFRYENLDARHEHTFDQFDLIYIDKNVTMANLQYLSEYFLKHMFGKDIKVRLKPGYYPFTEPSAGIQGQCIFCKGKGCKVCGNLGWLELAGAGMIHPQVLRNGGIDPDKYSGLAWGFGPPRMTMLKYGIEDVRLLLSGNLKFLEKF